MFLSTDLTAVPVYSAPSAEVVSTVTGRVGNSRFPPAWRTALVIVISDQGYGRATMPTYRGASGIDIAAVGASRRNVAQGATPLARETIHLSRTRFGSKLQEQTFRTVHDMTAQTGWSAYLFAQRGTRRYVDFLACPRMPFATTFSFVTSICSRASLWLRTSAYGRPITGRAVLRDSDEQIQFFGSMAPDGAPDAPRRTGSNFRPKSRNP